MGGVIYTLGAQEDQQTSDLTLGCVLESTSGLTKCPYGIAQHNLRNELAIQYRIQ